jgi:hypothetical protein
MEAVMTESGRVPAWRLRGVLMALALIAAVLTVETTWLSASAEQGTELTLLYHGAVTGKVAPCG